MSARRPKARLTLQQHQDALNYAFTGHSRPNDHLDQSDVYMVFCALIDSAEMVSYLRDRIAELEAERDAAKAGEEELYDEVENVWCDLEASGAREARAVEALRKLHSAASYVAEECNEDDWTVDQQAMLDLHEALDAVDVEEPCPALHWLYEQKFEAAQAERMANTDAVRAMGPHFCDFFFGKPGSENALRHALAAACREAIVAELRGLWSGWVRNDLHRSDVGEMWRYICDRIAALTNQQPTACPRSEVRGEERFRA